MDISNEAEGPGIVLNDSFSSVSDFEVISEATREDADAGAERKGYFAGLGRAFIESLRVRSLHSRSYLDGKS